MLTDMMPDLPGASYDALSELFPDRFPPGAGNGREPINGKSQTTSNQNAIPLLGHEKALHPEPGSSRPDVTVAHLRNATVTAFLYSTVKKIFGEDVRPLVVQNFIEEIQRECKATADPIEGWLIEQSIVLRHVSAFLHAAAVNAKSVQEIAVISNAANQTTGELRRVVVALRDYRADNGLSSRSKPAEAEKASTDQADCKKPQRPCKKLPRRRKAKVTA